MKKVSRVSGEIRPEYKFSEMAGGIRGKYAKRYSGGTNLVKIDPDVSKFFTDENSVNDALRLLIKVARQKVASV